MTDKETLQAIRNDLMAVLELTIGNPPTGVDRGQWYERQLQLVQKHGFALRKRYW